MALGLRAALNQKTQTSDLRPLSIMQTIKRELNEDGVLIKETWMCDGQIHRTDGPAVRCMDADGNICQETWALNHRYQGTCLWTRHPNGNLNTEQWWFDESEDSEKRHRTDGPAYLYWNDDGTLAAEEWFLDGKHHRTDGPAVQRWNDDGTLTAEEWWVDGKKTPRRTIVLARARAKVLRSSRLLILANAVQCVSADSLSVIGGFLK